MLCRYCGAPARVLSTRTPNGEFYVVRRMGCTAEPVKHRFNTVEVLETLIKKFAGKRVQELLGHNRRGAERMRTSSARRAAVLTRVRQGLKYDVVAQEVGVSVASVRKYVREAATAPLPPGRRPNGQRPPV